jgi:hypothetical protein
MILLNLEYPRRFTKEVHFYVPTNIVLVILWVRVEKATGKQEPIILVLDV